MPDTIRTRITIMLGMVLAIGVILIAMISLGFRSMRLDDLRQEHKEIHEQREMIFRSLDEANAERHALAEALRKLEARLNK